jgi:4-hydroxybenzoate polyprenyltransferase
VLVALRDGHAIAQPDRPAPFVIGALTRSLRPHQLVLKNLFVAAPLLFSKHLLDPHAALLTTLAFGLFCLLSGSVYLVNDIFDLEKDRAHPKKCLRPIASGKLPLGVAQGAAALLIVVGLGGALALGLPFFAVAAGYLVQNLAYSLALKRIPFVDVLLLAGGFLLRVVAGALAIAVPASPWLLGCTFALASFLGFGKRAHELATAGDRAGEQRAVLSRYKLAHLKVILWLTALATCAAYVLYTLSPHTKEFFGTDKLLFTAPFAAFGVIRYLVLVSNRASADSPTEDMLRDVPFMANLVLYALSIVFVIYFLR